jgi:hypothetical protein
VILERLVDGTVNLTAIGLLAPLLTPENHLELLDAARHKSKRDIEHLVAQTRPRPDAPAVIRKLPAPTPAAPSGVEGPAPRIPVPSSRRAEVKPLAPERYKIQFTVDRETHDKLRRAQDLMRHTIQDGGPAAIFDIALTLLLREISKAKHAATARPRSAHPPAAPPETTRHIPAAVRRAVWQRDTGQCAFVGGLGRCREKAFLEFHHLVPYADGGEATIANLALRCRAHNAYEAEQWYGAGRAPLLPDEQEPGRPNVGRATRSGPSSG